MEKLIYALVGIYIGWMAVTDIVHKEIPVWPGVVCTGVVSIIRVLAGNGWGCWIPGMGIGFFLFLINRISKGKIGAGDALVYVVTGAALGWIRNLELLIVSLFLASLGALILIVVRHVGRNYAMPFLPFTAVAFGMVVIL
jgi:prepilin signal peptidase PulO-like enzyme (type II secretory pathway)